MIEPASRDRWTQLRAQLRPFVDRRVATEADVDDVLQEILLRIQRGLPELREDARFGPWVYRIARNAVADHHRAHGRREAAVAPLAEEPAAPAADDDRTVERMLAPFVAPFVAMLPSPYREALTLTELEGLTQAEAAQMVGISLSGMKSRVQRGRVKLREIFEDCCEIAVDARRRIVACQPRPDGILPSCRCDDPPALPSFSDRTPE